jgi:polysaccharide export outer membrane protein
MKKQLAVIGMTLSVGAAGAVPVAAQSNPPETAPAPAATSVAPGGAVAPAVPGYVIGPEDQLSIVFWREKELSTDVVVRPDGNISIPLLNDVPAAGLTPDQLRERLTEQARRFVQDPNVTVVVRQINSRKVFVTGMVGRPGPHTLAQSMTVLQLIAMAGGLQEYAKEDKIVIMRSENGQQVRYRFNYEQVIEGRNLEQNIELRPGDTVIVP